MNNYGNSIFNGTWCGFVEKSDGTQEISLGLECGQSIIIMVDSDTRLVINKNPKGKVFVRKEQKVVKWESVSM